MTSWGKADAADADDSDDRIELIEDTVEARARFGENFGALEFKLTHKQIEGLLVGKVVAFDICQREYAGFLSLTE